MTLPHRINIQVDVNPYINQNSEFKSAYQHFERLLNVDESYFIGLNVGDIRHYRFKNGDAIVYSLVTETLNKGVKNYVIEIQDYVTKDVLEALIGKDILTDSRQPQEPPGLLHKFWGILQRGVERAASFDFYIQIAIAIGVLSILFASKIVSSDVPQINNRPPVPEQPAPKLPEKTDR